MKRRELLIIAGVLVPFFVLVALALSWSEPKAPPTVLPPLPLGGAPPLDAGVRVAVLSPEATAPTVAPPLDAGAPAPTPTTTVDDPPPPELEAPLRAVAAEVNRCFRDTHTRPHGPVAVTMRFTPLPDGGFTGARVEKDTGQDPYLDACLVDVFEELGFSPSGRETFREATYTFRSNPDGGR